MNNNMKKIILLSIIFFLLPIIPIYGASVPKVKKVKIEKRYPKKIKIKWKKYKKIDRFQIRVLKKKNRTYRLKRKIRISGKKRRKTVKKLRSSKTFYFRVRAKRDGQWGKYSKRVRGKTKSLPVQTDGLIEPSDLEYIGAFRMPNNNIDYEIDWYWGGSALTYNPNNNSLIGTGHPFNLYFSEISIPSPVISSNKKLSDLNRAETIQGFSDVIGELVDVSGLELPRIGLEYLDNKLYFSIGEHFQEESDQTHGYSNLNLSNPNSKGLWRLKNRSPYSTNDYIFKTLKGDLVSGRFRDGGWSGMGPSLFEFSDNYSSNIDNTALISYDSSENCTENCNTMDNYHHSDEWVGGAWLYKDNKEAVIFAGTKGTGDCWYGDENEECMDCDGDRCWWSTGFKGQILFYDPF